MNNPIFTELITKVYKKKIIGTYFVSEQVMNYFFIASRFSLKKTIDSFKMKMEMYPKDEHETLLKETIKETANKNVENNYIHRNSTERFYIKVTEFKECGEFNIFNLFQDFVINFDDFNNAYKKNDFKPYNYYLKNNEINIPELPEFNSIVSSVVNNFFLLFLHEAKPIETKQDRNITGFKTTLTETQIINLYENSKDKYITTDLQNLINLLKGKECNPITWKLLHGKKLNMFALRAFIETVFQNPTNPKTVGKQYFRDNQNRPIEIGKRNRTPNFDNYVEDFTKMLEKKN